MTSVVIIDDEPDVVNGLRTVVHWKRLGMSVVGDASNSIEAMSLIERTRPDIVMTDIRMPGPDGLALIESAKKVVPDAAAIIFTGYREFRYAKSAVSLGVTEYLQKPVSVEALEAALLKAARKTEEARVLHRSQDSLARAELVLRDREVRDVLDGRIVGSTEVERVLRDAGIDRRLTGFVVAVAECNGLPAARETREETDRLGLKMIAHRAGDETVLITAGHKDPETRTRLLSSLERLAAERAQRGEEARIGVGGWYPEISGLRSSYLEAAEAARYATFTGERLLVGVEHLDLRNGLPTLDRSAEEALLLHVRDGNVDRVMEGVAQFVQNVRRMRLSPDALRHECLSLVFRILRVSDETGCDYLSDKGRDWLPHVRLATLRDENQVLSWVTDVARDIARWTASVRTCGAHRSINRIADYLRANYAQGVTLKQLGDLVHLNPSYLSVLFKREMGVTYLCYLTNLRMEHAKALLDRGLKTWETGRSVGYYSFRHFAELFRRHVGMTPAEYRSRRRRAST